MSKNSVNPNLHFGTCSWKYDSWKGIVYDPAKKYTPYDYLPDYAKHFSTVEIDEWFWSLFPTGAKLPNPTTVKIYTDNVPENFLFTVKAPNAITLTHYYAKQPPQYQAIANQPNSNFLNSDLLNKFLEILRKVSAKCIFTDFLFFRIITPVEFMNLIHGSPSWQNASEHPRHISLNAGSIGGR